MCGSPVQYCQYLGVTPLFVSSALLWRARTALQTLSSPLRTQRTHHRAAQRSTCHGGEALLFQRSHRAEGFGERFFAGDQYEGLQQEEEEDEPDEALDNKQLARLIVIGLLCLAAMGAVTYVLHVVRAAPLLSPTPRHLPPDYADGCWAGLVGLTWMPCRWRWVWRQRHAGSKSAE